MTVLAPPPQDELELLIREARARQRRRWLGVAAIIALTSGIVLGGYSIAGGRSSNTSSDRGPRSVASLPRCGSDQLRLAFRGEGVAGGSVGDGFTLVNTSQTACTLRGWPRLTYTLSGGATHAVHARKSASIFFPNRPPVRTVLLRPRGSASFHLWSADAAPHATCPVTTFVRVTPPGASRSLGIAATVPYCGSRWIILGAFVSGPAGRYVNGA